MLNSLGVLDANGNLDAAKYAEVKKNGDQLIDQLIEANVLTDVSFGPKNKGLSGEEARKKAREAMRSVGLDKKYELRSPFELSGGQKRRAAIDPGDGTGAFNPG